MLAVARRAHRLPCELRLHQQCRHPEPVGAKHQLVIGGDEIPLWLRSRGSGDAVEGGGGAEMEGIAG